MEVEWPAQGPSAKPASKPGLEELRLVFPTPCPVILSAFRTYPQPGLRKQLLTLPYKSSVKEQDNFPERITKLCGNKETKPFLESTAQGARALETWLVLSR